MIWRLFLCKRGEGRISFVVVVAASALPPATVSVIPLVVIVVIAVFAGETYCIVFGVRTKKAESESFRVCHKIYSPLKSSTIQRPQ